MANIKSAAKRAEIARKNALRNAPVKTSVRTSIRKFIETVSKEDAALELKKAVVAIDKAVSKGVLHKNAAARKKSRLTKRLNRMS
ncbi:MAG: 30S ribosomal protein S20 [Firmicutes bacterium HGW-Firmicutes-14]|nr:MAG: 30S ribosomal protein S20 [Firmicutes bacterium HGW-Firmicutes-14]